MPQRVLFRQYQQITEPVVAAPERVSEDKWHQPWSLPVWKRTITTAEMASGLFFVQAIFAEEITPDKWFRPWSEPLHPKPGLAAYLQQSTTLNPFGMTQPERVSEDKWHQPWSLPVWHKPRLITGAQQAVFMPQAPTVPFSWFKPLSEPVRVKPRLLEALQRPITFERPPQVSFSWFAPLSEPVRKKPGLHASLQDFFALVQFSFGEIIYPDKWFSQLSLPVWVKPYLHPGYQPVLFQTITPHTIYLVATETPDTMLAALSRFQQLFGATVSIVEITPQFANMSSTIEPSVFANVAIVET